MIKINNIKKTFKMKKGNGDFQALKGITLDFPNTGFVFIIGKSGSGKSTLLNILGGLDKATSGEILIKERSSKTFKSRDFDSYRNTYLGFVFQEYNLLEKETIRKNIALALELQSFKGDLNEKVEEISKEVELFDKLDNKINEISGGQKQRVAIARALVKNPEIIIADEPTGNLDSSTGDAIMDTLRKLANEKLVIMVTHDVDYAAEYADRIIELKDGEILNDETIKERSLEQIQSMKLSNGIEEAIRIPKGKKVDMKIIDQVNDVINSNKEEDLFITISDSKDSILKIDKDISKLSDSEKGKVDKINLDYSETTGFKLIKSRYPNKDIMKFGAINVWNRKISLVFTFVLLIAALTMFGFSEAGRGFTVSSAVSTVVEEQDVESFEVTSVDYFNAFDTYRNQYSKNHLLENINEYRYQFGNEEYYYDSDGICSIEVSTGKTNFHLETCVTEGYIYAEEFDHIAFDNFLEGREPMENTSEVVITDYLADSLMINSKIDRTSTPSVIDVENAETIANYSDIVGSVIFRGMVVSGIVETNYNDYRDAFDAAQSSYDGNYFPESAPKDIVEDYSKWVSYRARIMYPFTFSNDADLHFISQAEAVEGDGYELIQESHSGSWLFGVIIINDMDELRDFFENISDQSLQIELSYQNTSAPIYTISTEASLFTGLRVVFKWMSIVFLVFAGLLLLSNISGSVLDRKKDIGTLRAIGAKGSDVSKIFIFESILISVFVSTIAIGVTMYITSLLNNWTASNLGVSVKFFVVSPGVILNVYFVGIIVAVISAFIPSRRVTMMKPIDAIRKV